MSHAPSRSRSVFACILFVVISLTFSATPPAAASHGASPGAASAHAAIGNPVPAGVACWARPKCRSSYTAYLTARGALVGVNGSYQAQVAAFTLLSATGDRALSVAGAQRLAGPGFCAVRSARWLVGLLDDVQRRGTAADNVTVMLAVAKMVRMPVPKAVVYLPADPVLPLAVAVAWKAYWRQQRTVLLGYLETTPC